MRSTPPRRPASSPNSVSAALWDSLFSELEPVADAGDDSTFTTYRYDPTRYIVDKLGWTPWLMLAGGLLGFIAGLRILMKSVSTK